MRRTLIIVVTAVAAALGGVWATSAVAPCALPHALIDKFAPGKSAACLTSAAAAAETPRVVAPPAVTVVPALKGDWRLALYIKNLLDERSNIFAYGNPFSYGLVSQVTPLRPRTVGIDLSWNY